MRHAQLEHLVHRLRRGHAFHHRIHRLIEQRHQHAVRHESRRIVHFHWCLLQLLRQRLHRRIGLVRSRQPANHLNQLHHRHRIEEVHPDHLVRTLGHRRQLRDRDRRRIRRQNHLRPAEVVQVAEELRLDLDALARRLDHEVAPRQPHPIHRRRNARHSAASRASAVIFSFATSRSRFLRDGLYAAIEKPLVHIHQHDVITRLAQTHAQSRCPWCPRRSHPHF